MSMKIISDIRIFKGVRMEQIGGKEMHLAAHRVAMKLREKGFSLGEYDHLYICFSTEEPRGSVTLDEDVDKYFPWFRKVHVGITPDALSAIETEGETSFLLEHIENVLLTLFGSDSASAVIIRDSIKDAEKGQEMLMHFKEKKTTKGTAAIYLKLLDNGHYLPVLSVKNIDGTEVLRENLPETSDLGNLGDIQLNSKNVTVKPRKNSYTEAKALKPFSFEVQL